MAVYGGVIVYGLGEDSSGALGAINLVDLEKTKQRVESIATTLIQPPLSGVECVSLRSEGKATGVLLVRVPPSPDQPHMVKGKYHVRSGSQTREMSDAEVRERILVGSNSLNRVREVLAEAISEDPFRVHGETSYGHLHIVAIPVIPYSGLLLRVARSPADAREKLNPILHLAANSIKNNNSPYSFSRLAAWRTRLGGLGTANQELSSDRVVSSKVKEDYFCELELYEDGLVRFLSCDVVEPLERESQPTRRIVFDGRIIDCLLQFLRLLSEYSKSVDYLGSWDVALQIDGLKSASSWMFDQSRYPAPEENRPKLNRDIYRAEARVTLQALDNDLQPQIETLLAPLFRGLGVESTLGETRERKR